MGLFWRATVQISDEQDEMSLLGWVSVAFVATQRAEFQNWMCILFLKGGQATEVKDGVYVFRDTDYCQVSFS